MQLHFALVPPAIPGLLSSASDLATYAGLRQHVWAIGRRIQLTWKRIAAAACCSVATVRRHAEALKAAGLINWEPAFAQDGGQQGNRFWLTEHPANKHAAAPEPVKDEDEPKADPAALKLARVLVENGLTLGTAEDFLDNADRKRTRAALRQVKRWPGVPRTTTSDTLVAACRLILQGLPTAHT